MMYMVINVEAERREGDRPTGKATAVPHNGSKVWHLNCFHRYGVGESPSLRKWSGGSTLPVTVEWPRQQNVPPFSRN